MRRPHLVTRLKQRKRERNRAIFEASNRAKAKALKLKLQVAHKLRVVYLFIDPLRR